MAALWNSESRIGFVGVFMLSCCAVALWRVTSSTKVGSGLCLSPQNEIFFFPWLGWTKNILKETSCGSKLKKAEQNDVSIKGSGDEPQPLSSDGLWLLLHCVNLEWWSPQVTCRLMVLARALGDEIAEDVPLRPLTSLKWPYVPEASAYADPLKRDDPKPLQLAQYEAIGSPSFFLVMAGGHSKNKTF